MRLITLSFAIGVICLLSFGCKTEETKPPNILIILADDLGYNQLGCFGGPYDTPHINRLASQGMRFDNAYSAAAVCSPTRAALMTGLYPARLHLTDFIKGNNSNETPLQQPDWQKFLPLEKLTMGEIFRNAGYRTAIFGKWHLSQEKAPPESEPYNPDKQGFDEYMVTYKPVRRQSDPEHDPHNVDSISNRSILFLQENADRPFLLIVSHNSIHDPVMESREATDRYIASLPDSSYKVRPELGAMVSRLDQGTGSLLKELENLGLEKNTIVFFLSDNGGKESYASQKPFRKGKGWLYEGGIHVPMILRWPGIVKEGQINSIHTITCDILPTIAEMAGLDINPMELDGVSLVPHIFGESPTETRSLYWHYPHYHRGSGMIPASALRFGDYKLIEWHKEALSGEDAWELYNLSIDPGENHNLSKEEPYRLDTMINMLHQWRNEVNAQMPVLR